MANQQTAEKKPSKRGGNPASLANLTGGSRKGSPNKTTASMKAAIETVYAKLQEGKGGDHKHFLEWAQEEPTEFYKLASKLIPLQLTGDKDNPIVIENKAARDAAVAAAARADA